MGTLVGAAIALGIEAHSVLPAVSTGVYLAFMIIQLTAIFSTWLLLPPHLVVRNDGTLVELEDSITPAREIKEFVKLFKDIRVLYLFPMFFASNYFYAYQGSIVAVYFNGRTRALASLLEGLGSIIGSIVIGNLLDRLPYDRRTRSMVGLAVVAVLEIIVWSGGIAFQVKWDVDRQAGQLYSWDWTVSHAVGPIILIMACESPSVASLASWNLAEKLRLHRRCRIPRSCILHHGVDDQRPVQACPSGRILQGCAVGRRCRIFRHGRG